VGHGQGSRTLLIFAGFLCCIDDTQSLLLMFSLPSVVLIFGPLSFFTKFYHALRWYIVASVAYGVT